MTETAQEQEWALEQAHAAQVQSERDAPLAIARFTGTAMDVIDALEGVRNELEALRKARGTINEAIRILVAQETLLERMARIAKEMLKEVNHDDDGGGAPPPALNE